MKVAHRGVYVPPTTEQVNAARKIFDELPTYGAYEKGDVERYYPEMLAGTAPPILGLAANFWLACNQAGFDPFGRGRFLPEKEELPTPNMLLLPEKELQQY